MSNTYPRAQYEVWLGTPTGQRLALLDSFVKLDYVLALNAVSRWSVTIPRDKVDASFIGRDMTVAIWRATSGRPAQLQTVGFVRQIGYRGDGSNDLLTLGGPDANYLLSARIVAYDADTAETAKEDYADDLMKAVVAENLGSSAATGRDLSGYGLSIDGDLSLGPSVKLAFAHRNVLDVLQEVADMAAEAGTPVYFRLQPVILSGTEIGYTFVTGVNQLNADRTYASDQPTVFSRSWGNLEAPDLQYDYNDEVTYLYAGGQGEGDDREIVTASDTVRMNVSPWGRREDWQDARNQNDTDGLDSAAAAGLEAGRPTASFVGTIKDTPQTRYGIEWDFGDRVAVSEFGLQLDGLVRAVRIGVGEDGFESIAARVEVDQ